jgi:hypothetical protein
LAKQARAAKALAPQGWSSYLRVRSALAEENDPADAVALKKEM